MDCCKNGEQLDFMPGYWGGGGESRGQVLCLVVGAQRQREERSEMQEQEEVISPEL